MRKPTGKRRIRSVLAAGAIALGLALVPHAALAATTSPMYRLYNHYNGDHMYTLSAVERDGLVMRGWDDEGTAWQVPDDGTPVWRLYNPYSGEHLFTLNRAEYDYLQTLGWNGEGEGFKSADETGKPIFRLYNHWLTAGTHLYTTDPFEYLDLERIGWSGEHVAFFGARSSSSGQDEDQDATVEYQGTIRIVRRSDLLKLLGLTKDIDSDGDPTIAVLELDHTQDLTLGTGDLQSTRSVKYVILPDSFAVEGNRNKNVTLSFKKGGLEWSQTWLNDLGIHVRGDLPFDLPLAVSGVTEVE